MNKEPTHDLFLSYVFWVFGFIGLHRYYYGKRWTGLLYSLTLGLLFIGWIVDAFQLPSWSKASGENFKMGKYSYNVAWSFLIVLGGFGIHRFYLGKPLTGLLFLFTGGLLGFGIGYDIWTLNNQINEENSVANVLFQDLEKNS